ncbi:hypothetical protein A2U01_0111104, partial [Trifolium medium]|nr:hypothetical protein [Trifolium medium]
ANLPVLEEVAGRDWATGSEMFTSLRPTSPEEDFVLVLFRQLSPGFAGREVMCLVCLFDGFECK